METVEEIREVRENVLKRYDDFKDGSRIKRSKLEDSRRFQYFKRDADELESWINEKLQTASDESWKDPTNLQAKIQKHQAFEAEVIAHEHTIIELDQAGMEMINQKHFASQVIQVCVILVIMIVKFNRNFSGTSRRDSSLVGFVATEIG